MGFSWAQFAPLLRRCNLCILRLTKRAHFAQMRSMSYVDKIVDAFGGVRPMAQKVQRPVSTVKSWKERGSIPDANKPDVLAVAKAEGLDLRPEHFFPILDEPEAPTQTQGAA